MKQIQNIFINLTLLFAFKILKTIEITQIMLIKMLE